MNLSVYKLLVVFAFALIAGSCKDKSESYVLTGNLMNLPDSIVVLNFQRPDYKVLYDTAIQHDGHFIFKGHLSEPTYAILWVHPDRDGILIYLENSAISISGDVDSLNSITVSGSQTHKDYELLGAATREVGAEREQLVKKYEIAAGKGDSTTVKHLSEAFLELAKSEKEITKHFIMNHPGSFVSIYKLRDLVFTEEYSGLISLYSSLSDEVKESDIGRAVGRSLETLQHTQIGAQALDFYQPNVKGDSVSLSQFRGSYVLLDFWASSCAPCRVENRNLVQMYKQYQEDGFEIVGVSYDANPDRWRTAIAQDSLTWTNLCDLKGLKNQVIMDYGVTSFPTNYLIDPHGYIIAKNLRGQALREKLAGIFVR